MRSEDNPILSVILPVYNGEKYLAKAIDSILNQTFRNLELIIADDGSTDSSRKIVNSYAEKDNRIIVSHNQVNQGKTNTVNRLFKSVRGEYFSIHDADDWSAIDRFEKQIKFLESNLDYGVVGSGFTTFNADGSFFDKHLMQASYDDILANIKHSSQMHGPTAVIRTSIGKIIYPIYRSYFKDNFEDIDFLYRVMSIAKGYNQEEYLYNYRIVSDSLCRKNVTIRNRNLYKIVYFLMSQRMEGKSDYLELSREDLVDQYFERITRRYKQDLSLIHREGAAYFLYWKLYRKAIKASVLSVIRNPFDLTNIRTLIYCIRKSIFK